MELKRDSNQDQILIKAQSLFCEFLGTFMLTYVGSWAIIFQDLDELGDEGVGFAHGGTLIIMTWLCFNRSGSHFNPAITLGMIVIRKIEWSLGMFYIFSQFIGGICAGKFLQMQLTQEVLKVIETKSLIGLPRSANPLFTVSGIWTEMFGTFFITYVYCSFIVETSKLKPFDVFPVAIGLVYFVCFITLGDISGGGFNPARALGPAIVIGKVGNTQFIQFFGPLLGGILGAIIYYKIFIDEDDLDEEDQDQTNVTEIKEYQETDDDMPQEMELH